MLDFIASEVSKTGSKEPRFSFACLYILVFTVFGNCERELSQEKITFQNSDSLKRHIYKFFCTKPQHCHIIPEGLSYICVYIYAYTYKAREKSLGKEVHVYHCKGDHNRSHWIILVYCNCKGCNITLAPPLRVDPVTVTGTSAFLSLLDGTHRPATVTHCDTHEFHGAPIREAHAYAKRP